MRPKFKYYNQSETFLLPPSLDEMIKETHPVRTINKIIDEIDISDIENNYIGGGATSYSRNAFENTRICLYE
ncbi:MAG: hypothetical protein M9949_02315 [Candidatus Kapabacteria bacterium]|nr:hypothetical protein [Candidatus Kapabacteria bacterium]